MPHCFGYISRRRFLKSMAAAAACAQCSASLRASLVQPVLANAEAGSASVRLDPGWEYFRGALDGPWEVWRGNSIAAWEQVSLPIALTTTMRAIPISLTIAATGGIGRASRLLTP